MASTNPSSTRLNRSTSDASGVKRQRTHGAESRVADGGKGTLPKAKIQALEQFVKFGRKGKTDQKAGEFPPPSWFESTSTSTTSPPPPPAADSARNTTTRGAPHPGTSSPSPHPRTPPQHPSRTGSTASPAPRRATPEIALSTSRRATPETGVDPSHAIGTASAATGASLSPTLQRRGSSFPGSGAPDGDNGDVTPPEPLTLARRIQTLLSSPWSAPQAPTNSTPSVTDATTSSGAPQSEIAGPATPDGSMPPGPVPITDSRFLAFLSNENLMGGSLDKGRQSVFAILDRLRRPSARNTEGSAGSAPPSASEREQDESDDDGDSIMLYGPIVPSEDSEVELAASDIMSVFDDGETLEYEQPARPLSFAMAGEQVTPRSHPISLSPEPAQQEETAGTRQPDAAAQGGSGSTGWFDTWKGKVIEGGKLVSDKVTEGTKSLKGTMGSRKVVKTRTRWVPSPDKISFQATWWGYRLYLPPPVLDVLNNTRLEAAKRAAMITTALQWLLGHVPLTVVPPQFRVGVLVARRLVPYLGYVGGFVAWSWGAMKSFDKGHGVVLTATWVLPVALIPGTFVPNEVPDSTSRNADPGARSPPGTSTSGSNSTRVG